MLSLGVVLTIVNAYLSVKGGVRAGHDPWGGETLEWFATSPPPPHNFDVVPDVRSDEPLRDIREAVRRQDASRAEPAETHRAGSLTRMAGPGAGGGGAGLRRFRRLADLTAVVTFLLIIVGGVVRVSDSGLGCGLGGSGTKGWPLCGGDVIPLVGDENTFIEFSHRLLAAVVVVLIALLCWRALYATCGNRNGWAFRGSIAAGLLVLVQAGLGGLTVEHSLKDELVAAHLGTAMILFGLLLWLSFKARSEAAVEADQPVRAPVRGLKPYAVTAAVLLLCAIVAGGYMAGTEERGVNEVGPNIAGRPSRLRPPVPDLRRRQVPALREQPADRHPPHPPGLRLRGDARDHPAAQRRLRARLARPPAPARGVAPARRAGAARRHERLARRARGR